MYSIDSRKTGWTAPMKMAQQKKFNSLYHHHVSALHRQSKTAPAIEPQPGGIGCMTEFYDRLSKPLKPSTDWCIPWIIYWTSIFECGYDWQKWPPDVQQTDR